MTSCHGWELICYQWIHPRPRTCGVLRTNDSTRFRLRQSMYAQPLSGRSPLFRDHEVFMDTDVSMKACITATVQLCFAILQQVRSVQHSLPQQALQTLIWSLIIRKVDYWCSLLDSLLDRFQSLLDAAAQLIFSAWQSLTTHEWNHSRTLHRIGGVDKGTRADQPATGGGQRWDRRSVGWPVVFYVHRPNTRAFNR